MTIGYVKSKLIDCGEFIRRNHELHTLSPFALSWCH